MKKTLALAVAVGVSVVIGLSAMGCGGDSPSTVVKKYIAAIEKGDAKALGELCTPEVTDQLIPFLEKAKGVVAAYGGIASTEEKIDGDNAVVSVTYKNGKTEELNLTKVNGKWKMSK
jgi:hypothetical protein